MVASHDTEPQRVKAASLTPLSPGLRTSQRRQTRTKLRTPGSCPYTVSVRASQSGGNGRTLLGLQEPIEGGLRLLRIAGHAGRLPVSTAADARASPAAQLSLSCATKAYAAAARQRCTLRAPRGWSARDDENPAWNGLVKRSGPRAPANGKFGSSATAVMQPITFETARSFCTRRNLSRTRPS